MRHELSHIRRRDIWLRWASEVAVIVYWFNPFAWIVRRALRQAQELAADDAVLRHADGDARAAYGHTLLDVAAFGQGPVDMPSVSGVQWERISLAARIRRIYAAPAPNLMRMVTGMATVVTVVLTMSVAALASGFRGSLPVRVIAGPQSKVVAWVNGVPISTQALRSEEAQVRKLAGEGPTHRLTLTNTLEQRALRLLVQNLVLAETTRARGFDPTVAQAQAAYKHLVTTDPSFLEVLKKYGDTATHPTAAWISGDQAVMGASRLEHAVLAHTPTAEWPQAWARYVDLLVKKARVIMTPTAFHTRAECTPPMRPRHAVHWNRPMPASLTHDARGRTNTRRRLALALCNALDCDTSPSHGFAVMTDLSC